MSIYRDISISISIYIEKESVFLVTSKYNNTKFPDLTELLFSVFLPGESQGRWSVVAVVYGVAQSWTRLKRLSSSSSSIFSWE